MQLIKIKSCIKAGITKPHYVTLSNNKAYILKFPGNPEKEKALINEYISYKIADMLELPLLPFSIAKIDFNKVNGIENLDKDVEQINGCGFASLYNRSVSAINNYKIIKLASNGTDFLKTIIFDFIIGNYDRNRGNLLYDQKQKKLVIIDHTHVFLKGVIFRKDELDIDKDKDFSFEDINPNAQRFYSSLKNTGFFDNDEQKREIQCFVDKVKQITKPQILEIIKEAQKIWFFDEDDVLSLCDFIYTRMKRVNEIILLLEMGGKII